MSKVEKTALPKAVESTPQSASGIEDLFKDSPSVTPNLAPATPQKDVKNDIMSLFEKVWINASMGLRKIVGLLPLFET